MLKFVQWTGGDIISYIRWISECLNFILSLFYLWHVKGTDVRFLPFMTILSRFFTRSSKSWGGGSVWGAVTVCHPKAWLSCVYSVCNWRICLFCSAIRRLWGLFFLSGEPGTRIFGHSFQSVRSFCNDVLIIYGLGCWQGRGFKCLNFGDFGYDGEG